jgi:enoyl-CoA hydratase
VACQGGVIGGAVDLICAGDIRWCTEDAFFCIQETNIAMTADVGTFPRLQRLIPEVGAHCVTTALTCLDWAV